MPSRSRPLPSRGCCVAALLLASVTLAADPPATGPSESPTTGPTSRPDRQMPPPVDSLDAVRLDRRMTLFQSGPTVEPAPRPGQELDPETAFWIELPSHRDLVIDLARRLGLPAPTVRLLPEESGASSRYGIVTTDHAILRKTPADVPGDRENLSDVTLGEPVWILDADDAKTSLLVHASDGYLGWVDAAAVWAVEAKLFTNVVNREKIFDRGKISGSFKGLANPSPSFEDSVRARNVKGLQNALDAPGVRAGRRSAETPIATARGFSGAPYVWGGKTRDGIDCSGLAQIALASIGIPLPRDADQQSLVGRLVATRWDTNALLPGDLLFYVSPRRGGVHHVAIYLGHGEYIEAAGPDVHVSSMTPGAPNYDAKRAATFGWARRVIE